VAVLDRLASLPCVVVAVDRDAAEAPALADVVPDGRVASADDILAAVAANPVAAVSLALLLRNTLASPGAGLVAESAVYSLLQSGEEFGRWRAARPAALERAESGQAVRLERTDDRLDIVLNRPHVRNALNVAMRTGLLEALALAAADPSISRIVLRGEGPSFCSGGDLTEFGTFTTPAAAHAVRLATSIGRELGAVGPRLRAEVQGPCAGSGVELAAFAGTVVARADFTAELPELSFGLIPGAGGTVSVRRRIGRHRTALLGLSGSRIDATTAMAWGLVDELSDGMQG
jgi:Enoyl-CoA hydratase/isomerase